MCKILGGMTMDFAGRAPELVTRILTKLEENADLIGVLYGGLAPTKADADMYYGGDILDALLTTGELALKNLNFRLGIHQLKNITKDPQAGETFKNGILALIAGYALKELEIHPTVTRLGNFAEPFGWSTTFLSALWTFVHGMSLEGAPPNTARRKYTRTEEREIYLRARRERTMQKIAVPARIPVAI